MGFLKGIRMGPKAAATKAAAPAAKKAESAVTVPETVLKKRKTVAKLTAEKAAAAAEAKKKRKSTRREIFNRAEKYVKEYRMKEQDEVRLKRQAKANGNFYVPAEAKLAFVVRIKGINGVAPKTRKILQLLRLLQINNG